MTPTCKEKSLASQLVMFARSYSAKFSDMDYGKVFDPRKSCKPTGSDCTRVGKKTLW